MNNPALTELLTRPEGLATRLRVVRIQAGLNGRMMARRLGWGPNKISRLENGHQLPTRDEIDAWTAACDRPDVVEELVELLGQAGVARFTWRQRLAGDDTNIHVAYTRLFEQSRKVSMVDVAIIPAPLQTAAYARAVLTTIGVVHATPAAEIDAAVAERARQAALLRARSFEFIIAESVLRRAPCRPDEMIEQLGHLIELLPAITLRILPDRAGVGAVPVNSFHVFDRVLVLVESFVDEREHHADRDTVRYLRALDHLRRSAVSGDDAAALIDHAVAFHRSGLGIRRVG